MTDWPQAGRPTSRSRPASALRGKEPDRVRSVHPHIPSDRARTTPILHPCRRCDRVHESMASRSVNKVILLGNLGKDAETRFTTGGAARTTFSVATSRRWKDQATGEWKEETDWHDVVLWRQGKPGHLPDKRAAGLRRRPHSDAELRGQGRQESLQDRGCRRRTSPAGRAWRRRGIGGFAVAGGLQAPQRGSPGRSSSRRTAGGIRRNRRRRTVLTAPRVTLQSCWGSVRAPTVSDPPAVADLDSPVGRRRETRVRFLLRKLTKLHRQRSHR